MDLLRLANQEKELLLEIRRHLHEHPELSGEEKNTVQYIEEKLSEFGIPYVEVEYGGVLGFLEGAGPGKTLLMRADCDALPIEEDPENYKGPKTCVSKVPGVQHACGHDFHTASLLVSAKILNEHKLEWKGNVILFFERSEEKGGPYQKNLLEYIENHRLPVDGAWAMHVNARKAGVAYFMAGYTGAGVQPFTYTIKGKGGHGSRPYEANNPIDCFKAIAAAMDQIRMKKLSPYEPVTLTICSVHSGIASNVIPETLTFSGNGRFFDREKTGLKLRDEISRLVHSLAEAYGCEVTEESLPGPGFPNQCDSRCVAIAEQMFEENFGPDSYCSTKDNPSMGSESFARIASTWPSVMFGFGIANEEKGITAGIHHPKFDIDEEKAHLAVAYCVGYAVDFLAKFER